MGGPNHAEDRRPIQVTRSIWLPCTMVRNTTKREKMAALPVILRYIWATSRINERLNISSGPAPFDPICATRIFSILVQSASVPGSVVGKWVICKAVGTWEIASGLPTLNQSVENLAFRAVTLPNETAFVRRRFVRSSKKKGRDEVERRNLRFNSSASN